MVTVLEAVTMLLPQSYDTPPLAVREIERVVQVSVPEEGLTAAAGGVIS